jgi:hypothetical protein
MPAMRKLGRGRIGAQKCCHRNKLPDRPLNSGVWFRSFEGSPEPSPCQTNTPTVAVNQQPRQMTS